MIIGSIERPDDSVHVEFDLHEIEKDSSWSYLMTFKSPKYGDIIKDYVIRKAENGQSKSFILDEKDGIIIDLSLFGNTFYSVFELHETRYISTLSRTSDGIYFHLFVAPNAHPRITSPETNDDDSNGIEVRSYSTTMHQTAILKKHE